MKQFPHLTRARIGITVFIGGLFFSIIAALNVV